MGDQLERYSSKRENIKMHFACLVRVTAEEEQTPLQNQLVSLSNLWSNVQKELVEKTKLLISIIERIEAFNRNYDVMDLWLKGIENAASNEGLGTSPEKQKDRIKQVTFKNLHILR